LSEGEGHEIDMRGVSGLLADANPALVFLLAPEHLDVNRVTVLEGPIGA
jgi:hypothetical protein